MANTKISQLPSATTPLAGTELVPIVQGGVTKNVAAQNVVTPGGSTTQIQYNNAGAFAGATNVTYDGTNVKLGATGALQFADTDSSNYVAFKAPATIASNVTWTLPNTDGLPDQVLITNGFGVLSWATPTLTPTAPTNNTLPVVSGPPGTPTVGQTFNSTTGTWSGYPAPSFQYQWVRGASTDISGATSSSYQLTDTDLGTTVKCRVTATNTAGSANATSAATATIAAGPPQAPTGVTAVPGNTQATVSFSAPTITGGSPITGYTVTSSPPGGTASGLSLSQTVTGLTNGVSYTFTVTATNAIGTSDASAASNSVTPSFGPSSVNYLVVAGGGGGANLSGGGGAGGYLTGSTSVTQSTPYSITVGAGGSGGAAAALSPINGSNGSTSSAFGFTSTGGGAGGAQSNGATGGSGGGGGDWGGGGFTGGAATSGQGFAGGNGAGNDSGGGGGGGAGAVGQNGTSSQAGNGGVGLNWQSLGTFYAGGGGAGRWLGSFPGCAASAGGNGGGGAGGPTAGSNGIAGTANTGGGGGGGTRSTGAQVVGGGNGGTGVVIIRYPNTFADATSTTGSPTFVNSGGFKYYTFTGNGSITW